MKSNKNTKEIGYLRRLKNESLILSCLGGLSSKIIYFLKVSILSFFLNGSDKSDTMLAACGINNSLKKWGFKKRVSQPVKTAFAKIADTSRVTTAYRSFVNRAIYTPVGSYSAFFVTFGIYVGIVFCVKYYAFGETNTSIYSLINGCVIILAAFPLLFSKKALVDYIGRSTFLRRALKECIPLEVYNDKCKGSAVGTALLLGSVFGVLSFFFEETSLLAMLGALVLGMVIFASPEFGLFTAALVFPFASKTILTVLIAFTFGSYAVKVLRGKRNLHINAGSIFVIMLLVLYGFAALKGGGEDGWFAFSMAAVYLLAANLLVTKRLMKKCVQTLCLGFGMNAVVMAFEVFVAAYKKVPLLEAINGISFVFPDVTELVKYSILLLPFVFCKAEGAIRPIKAVGYALVLACMGFAIIKGELFLAVLASISVTLCLAITRRQIFRPIFVGIILPIIGLYLWGFPISLGGEKLYAVISSWGAAIKVSGAYPFFGIGTSEASYALAGLGDSNSMYLQTLVQLGAFGFFILCLAVVFSLQRLYTALPPKGDEERRIVAAAGACAIVGLIFATYCNLWDNTALCFMLWLSLGLASAACHTRIHEKGETEDEYGE